jgi:UDPglucose 6-dehydrogenase
MQDLYAPFVRTGNPVIVMDVRSAELTKISVNSYVTMKISFTNQLRMIAEQLPKANIHDILAAIGSDSRIGSKYLRRV